MPIGSGPLIEDSSFVNITRRAQPDRVGRPEGSASSRELRALKCRTCRPGRHRNARLYCGRPPQIDLATAFARLRAEPLARFDATSGASGPPEPALQHAWYNPGRSSTFGGEGVWPAALSIRSIRDVHELGRTPSPQRRDSRPRRTAERTSGTRLALRAFMVIVLAHWAEHLLQAFQIYALGWPVPESQGPARATSTRGW